MQLAKDVGTLSLKGRGAIRCYRRMGQVRGTWLVADGALSKYVFNHDLRFRRTNNIVNGVFTIVLTASKVLARNGVVRLSSLETLGKNTGSGFKM